MVPDVITQVLQEDTRYYSRVLGLEPIMDHGWIVTLADPVDPGAQISLMTHDATAPVTPDVSVQVYVDSAYAAALEQGAEIVHSLTDEPWGVRRLFIRAPGGHVVNVLSHP